MSIPYSDLITYEKFTAGSHGPAVVPTAPSDQQSQVRRAASEVFRQGTHQPVMRSIQFIRDSLRLVLKVPVRSLILTPIFQKKNWAERQRSLINAKLTGYAFVQLVSVPAKFLVAIAAIVTSAVSQKKAQWLLDKSDSYTNFLDGRTSQLEALKEEGAKKATTRREFEDYRTWLYGIDAKLCRKTDAVA